MKINESGCCSRQEYSLLITRIFDAINEWGTYYDSNTEYLGLSIHPSTYQVMVCNEEECEKPSEWFAMEPLMLDGEPSADAVLELADQFCFVR